MPALLLKLLPALLAIGKTVVEAVLQSVLVEQVLKLFKRKKKARK
jgi:hypothetical protein